MFLTKTMNHNDYISASDHYEFMWSFQRFTPSKVEIPETKMSNMRAGMEARYSDRFEKFVGTTDDYLKKADAARATTDTLRTAVGVVNTQKENIDELFTAAELMVRMVNDFQRQTGSKQVNNIPLASDSIRSSPGKKLGYVKLVMKFISSGMLHFMEVALEMGADIKAKEAVIRAIGEDAVDVPILGRLNDIEIGDLSDDSPIVETKIPLDTSSEEDSILSEATQASLVSSGSVSSSSAVTTPEKAGLSKGETRPMTPSPNPKKGPFMGKAKK